MKKFVAFTLTVALACAGISVAPCPGTAPLAFAAYDLAPSSALVKTQQSEPSSSAGGSQTLATGKSKQLDLVAPETTIVWTSSNERIATVSQTGKVSAKRAGVARITAYDPQTGQSVVYTVKTYKKRTQAQAKKAILALKKKYRQGKRWTDKKYYYWQAANCHCHGCVAFVGIASDKAFGKFAPLKRHSKLSKIKIGDHVRIGGNHSVIVIGKKKKSIQVAEGNYNDKINWGRTITFAELKRSGYYIETRY